MWRLSKHAALFAVGAIAYFEIELRGRSPYTGRCPFWAASFFFCLAA